MAVHLGDFIGHILSEITTARAQADSESVRLAELYAEHELMKTFPVPRIRIQDVQINVPVIVTGITESKGGPRGGVDVERMEKIFNSIVDKRIHMLDSFVKTTEKKKLSVDIKNKLGLQYKMIKQQEYDGLDAGGIADKLTKRLEQELKSQKIPLQELNQFLEIVKRDSREEFLMNAESPTRLIVGVTAAEIREASADAIMNISMKITEEAMEWTMIDTNKSGLTPE